MHPKTVESWRVLHTRIPWSQRAHVRRAFLIGARTARDAVGVGLVAGAMERYAQPSRASAVRDARAVKHAIERALRDGRVEAESGRIARKAAAEREQAAVEALERALRKGWR